MLAKLDSDAGDDVELRRVLAVHEKTTDHLRLVSFTAASGDTQTITTTDEHPFFVLGRGWLAAGSLALGDLVMTIDGSFSRVTATRREEHPEGVKVYNLTVEGDHTFFVDGDEDGVGALWVHNTYPVIPGVYGPKGKQVINNREVHHLIPWNHKYFNHQMNPLVVQAGVDLRTYGQNMKSLLGHGGRHTKAMHLDIRTRLNVGAMAVAGKGKAAAIAELDNVLGGIWQDIKSGALTLYKHKDVLP